MSVNIIIVTSEFGKHGGGLSTSASTVAEILLDLGFNVQIVVSSQSDIRQQDSGKFKIINSSIRVIGGGYNINLQRDLFFRAHLDNVLLQLKNNLPEIIIAFGAGLNGLFASHLSGMLKAQLIVMPRGSEVNLAISNMELLHYNRECLRKASAVVAVSSELLERAKDIYYNENCIYKVIPNVIDIEHIHLFEKERSASAEVIIGTGAKYLNEKKGIANLILALNVLNKKSNRKFQLRLAGFIDEDMLANYKELVHSIKATLNVKFLGALERSQFLEEMKQWDIALQCSFCEGFSNSIGDAISLSKPFLTSNTGFIAEQIRTDYPELIFLSLAPEAIAEKIHDSFFNQDLVEVTKNAIEHLKDSVSKQSVTSSWNSFIHSIVFNKTSKITVNHEHITSVLLHEISESDCSGVDLPFSKLNELCENVQEFGLRLCSADAYFKSTEKKNLIVCTFDDGYKSVLELALPILKKYDFTATVFVCTNHIGKTNDWNPKDRKSRCHMNEEELKLLFKEGWEIGSHGTNHISFNRLDEVEIVKSLANSRQILESLFGEIVSFAYPYGDTSPFIQSIAKKYYRNVFTTNSGGTHSLLDRHRIKRYSFDEIQTLFKNESSRNI